MFRNLICFYGEELLAPRPTPKLEDHPTSAVRGCLFYLFTATLHIGGRSSIGNLRTRHAVVAGTHNRDAPKYITFKYLVTEVAKWRDEKRECSALLRLLDIKLHLSLDTSVHTVQYHCFGLSVSVIDCNTTDSMYSEMQGDQKVSVHLTITVQIIRYAETFWTPCISVLIPPCADHLGDVHVLLPIRWIFIMDIHAVPALWQWEALSIQPNIVDRGVFLFWNFLHLILCDSQWRMLQETTMH